MDSRKRSARAFTARARCFRLEHMPFDKHVPFDNYASNLEPEVRQSHRPHKCPELIIDQQDGEIFFTIAINVARHKTCRRNEPTHLRSKCSSELTRRSRKLSITNKYESIVSRCVDIRINCCQVNNIGRQSLCPIGKLKEPLSSSKSKRIVGRRRVINRVVPDQLRYKR